MRLCDGVYTRMFVTILFIVHSEKKKLLHFQCLYFAFAYFDGAADQKKKKKYRPYIIIQHTHRDQMRIAPRMSEDDSV